MHMADIAEDVKVDDPLMDILTEDEQSPPKESSPEEQKPAPVEDTEEITPPDVPTADADEPEESGDEEDDERPQGKAEARKAQLNTEIRDLLAQRNAIKAEVEKANAEVYQPDSYEDLVSGGMSELEAKVEAMRQENEMIKYNTQVAEAQLTINTEADRVLRDFPIFNPEDTDNYDAELAEQAAELLQANLIYDPNSNQIIGSNVSPYKLYQTIARASESSAVKGQLKAQQATEKMLANADASSSSAPPAKKAPDPIEDVWSNDD
jgi:hypothetical protein